MRQMTVGGLPSKSKDDLRPAGIGSKAPVNGALHEDGLADLREAMEAAQIIKR
jgi:hypothetical protein